MERKCEILVAPCLPRKEEAELSCWWSIRLWQSLV